jgi:hypothetical protein
MHIEQLLDCPSRTGAKVRERAEIARCSTPR